MAREQGFALLIVLWTLVLLSLLGTRIIAAGRTEAQLASSLQEAASNETAADSGIYQTLFHLLAARDQHWAAPGTYRVVVGGAVVEVEIKSLAGRVNPNTATPELLQALLGVLGVDPQRAASLTAAIVEWRTPRGSAPGRDKGQDYLAAGRIYGPPGAPFADIDELGYVLGMTPELLAQLRPHLTLWWQDDPDPAFADPAVTAAMRALGDTRPRLNGVEHPVQVVSILATATSSHGGRFMRHIDATTNSPTPGMPWRILAWDEQGT